jgi:hypothetical protein
LDRIDRVARRILHSSVEDLIRGKSREIMTELQDLMEEQRHKAVGNADAEEQLTRLLLIFAPICRSIENYVCT